MEPIGTYKRSYWNSWLAAPSNPTPPTNINQPGNQLQKSRRDFSINSSSQKNPTQVPPQPSGQSL